MKRSLLIATILALVLAFLAVTLVLAQDGDEEAQRELARALAAEAGELSDTVPVMAPSAVVTAPLFVAVDEPLEFAYRVEPADGTAYPQFSGNDIWAAAFDPVYNRIFFTEGVELWEWPLDGSPIFLGNITSGGLSTSIVGLAYHDGKLYGSRTTSPEGIYTIDITTLEATQIITYIPPTSSTDIGGLAIDPTTGTIYGTNDSLALRGLVEIALDGTVTVVAPYPDAQSDIDGLAIGDGRAYLVTDEPGSIYVYDFALGDYTTPIPNPWTTAEIFSAGAWIDEAQPQPGINLDKTVGEDPNVCATTSQIAVAPGTSVTYCYEITNTGSLTLTLHDLDDSELGIILNAFPYALAPGASAYLTQTTTIVTDTVNLATWTAYNPGPIDVVTATATATVTVMLEPDITVDPLALAATLEPGQTASDDVTIGNVGDADLDWSVVEAADDGCVAGDLPWASADPTSGTTAAGGTSTVAVTFDATGLAAGTYEGALCVNSNDPDEPQVAVALALTVTEEPPPVEYDLYLPVVVNAASAGQTAVPAAVLLGGLLLVPLLLRRR